MVSTRPTESPEWAEGTPPAIAGTNPPTDPGAGRRSSGYGFEERLPHESFNWVIRTLGRWIGWLEEKVDDHVHDGGVTEASVAKVDLENHINYGQFAAVSVTRDEDNPPGSGGAGHEIRYTFTGSEDGRAVLRPDVIRADATEIPMVWNDGFDLVDTILTVESDPSPGVDEQTITVGPILSSIDVTFEYEGSMTANNFTGANAPRVSLRRTGSKTVTGFNGLNLTFADAGTPSGSRVLIDQNIAIDSVLLVTPHSNTACFATVYRDTNINRFYLEFFDAAGNPVVPGFGFSLLVFEG